MHCTPEVQITGLFRRGHPPEGALRSPALAESSEVIALSATKSTDAWPPDSGESPGASHGESSLAPDDLEASLMEADPQLHTLVSKEVSRQRQTLDMIG